MIKLLKDIITGNYKAEFTYKKLIDKHLDDYYTLKDKSLVDCFTGVRMYILAEFGNTDTNVIDLCIIPESFPRVDFIDCSTVNNQKRRHTMIIIPESWYRKMGQFDRFALIHFLVIESIFIHMDSCLYEEDEHIIYKLGKIFPDLLAPVTNAMIKGKILSYNDWKKEEGEIPKIYLTDIEFKNIKGMDE